MRNNVIKKFFIIILILAILTSIIHIYIIPNESQALSASYTQYVKSGISAFPESYQKELAYLKYLHPNWQFNAYYTGIDWSEVTSSAAENACLKNTIYKGNLLDPTVLCICGQMGDAGYYCASAKTVNYYLDPRNFMGEAMIFQFLDLSNGTGVTRDIVARAVSGTYLEQYIDDIMTAASQASINPLHIVATIFQEIGRGSNGIPTAISGTVPGYEGLYNFYNYGATDGSGAVERGLIQARELGWTSPSYALIDGAKRVLASEYISVGQTTKYFYKFDVVGNEILTEAMGSKTYSSSYFYSHQYMTNLRDPSDQAGTIYDIYAESGILDEQLTFTIPVYNNMSAQVSTPTTLTGDNLYYIDSLKKYGIEFRSSAGGATQGNIYKDTVVVLLENQGYWSRVKINAATTYNSSSKSWNFGEKIGYVATEYLTKVGTEVPDYRNQVDMGSNNNSGQVTGTAEFKIDGDNIKMTPSVTVEDIKSKYTNAVIKRTDGIDISNTSDLLGTGTTVTIDGKTYTVVKLGDVNGDGNITPSDYVKVVNQIMGTSNLNDTMKLAADINKDGSITPADYVKIVNQIMGYSSIGI